MKLRGLELERESFLVPTPRSGEAAAPTPLVSNYLCSAPNRDFSSEQTCNAQVKREACSLILSSPVSGVVEIGWHFVLWCAFSGRSLGMTALWRGQ